MREIIIDNTDEKSIITLVENSIVTEKYEEDFNKKNNPKNQNVLKINISELVVSNEIKREEIDQLKKDIKSFFNF